MTNERDVTPGWRHLVHAVHLSAPTRLRLRRGGTLAPNPDELVIGLLAVIVAVGVAVALLSVLGSG